MNQQYLPPNDAPSPDSLSLIQLLNLSLKTPDYGVVNFRSLYVLLEYLINRMNIAQDHVDLCDRPSREVIRRAANGIANNDFRNGTAEGGIPNGTAEGGMRTMTNGVVDYRDGGPPLQEPFHDPSITSFSNQQRIAALEQKVGTLRMQMETFLELPTNGRLAEKADCEASGFQQNGSMLNIFEPEKGATGGSTGAEQRRLSQPMRASGPMLEAWQLVLLSKRMDAAEQALEKAFSLTDEILQGLGRIKNLKNNLVNYIRKWMLNPDAAFQDVSRKLWRKDNIVPNGLSSQNNQKFKKFKKSKKI
jgi:hypothetical protein